MFCITIKEALVIKYHPNYLSLDSGIKPTEINAEADDELMPPQYRILKPDIVFINCESIKEHA